MARKPKIQAVVDEALFEQFQDWKLENGFETDGDAIRAILHKVILGDIGEISGDNEIDSRIGKIENMLGESLNRIKQLEKEVSELKAPHPSEEKEEENSESTTITEDISEDINPPQDETPQDDGTEEELSQESIASPDISHNTPEAKIKELIQSNPKHWDTVATLKQAAQAREIAGFLIENGFEEESFSFNATALSRWKKPNNSPPKAGTKTYLAWKTYEIAIYPRLKD